MKREDISRLEENADNVIASFLLLSRLCERFMGDARLSDTEKQMFEANKRMVDAGIKAQEAVKKELPLIGRSFTQYSLN